MGYAKEFNHLEYNVPAFLLTDAEWEDVSWHNDVCPRWENKVLRLAVWVDCNEPECREYDDWKQYTVVGIEVCGDETQLLDDVLFDTEVQYNLQTWIAHYTVKLALEEAFRIAGMYNPAIADELATLIAEVQEAMNNIIDQEVPDCNPAGEPW